MAIGLKQKIKVEMITDYYKFQILELVFSLKQENIDM